ncbi:Uncharacterised protein [Salmonella enterica subsp. enterica serovar Typhi]|nr:Uncharacterised protein [Salmonella enterica subsp. enterica serovar Typhi]
MRAQKFRFTADFIAQFFVFRTISHAIRHHQYDKPTRFNLVDRAQHKVIANVLLVCICRIKPCNAGTAFAKRYVTNSVVIHCVFRRQSLKRPNVHIVFRVQQLVDSTGDRRQLGAGHYHSLPFCLLENTRAS